MNTSHLSEHLKNPENLKRFQEEALLLDIASLIDATMRRNGMNRSELAEKLGVSKGRVSQILGGYRNLTLRKLADVFTALDCRLTVNTHNLRDDWSVHRKHWGTYSEHEAAQVGLHGCVPETQRRVATSWIR